MPAKYGTGLLYNVYAYTLYKLFGGYDGNGGDFRQG